MVRNMLQRSASEAVAKIRGVRGFVLPVVIFSLVLLSTMALVGLLTSQDEYWSSSAMRQSSSAFYAAEAGLNEVLATWDSTRQAAVDSLSPGDSLTLNWRTLDGGARYRARIYRWDDGGQPMYELSVEGRGAGARRGQRVLTLALTAVPSVPGEGYKVGECCEATAVVKGTFGQRGTPDMKGNLGQVFQSGYDTHPPGWEAAGVCSDSLYDKPGVVMQDTSGIELDPDDAVLEGVPPILEDPTISDSIFEYFGEYTWEDIKAKAEIVIDTFGYVQLADGSNRIKIDDSPPSHNLEGDEVYPRYTTDPITGELLCDTSHPLNWGSDDPDDPCFDHFPIILTQGEVDLRGGPYYGGDRFYGQGIFILDYDTAAGTGSELEFEHEANFRGMVLGRGCVEIQYGAQYYGSVYLDATYHGETCDKSTDLWVNCNSDDSQDGPSNPCQQTTVFQWSQCAVDRAIRNSGLEEYAEPTVPGETRVVPIGSRAFGESLR